MQQQFPFEENVAHKGLRVSQVGRHSFWVVRMGRLLMLHTCWAYSDMALQPQYETAFRQHGRILDEAMLAAD